MFVVRFAARYAGDGLTLPDAARAAVRDMAGRVIRGVLENAQEALGSDLRRGGAARAHKNRERPGERKGGASGARSRPDPEAVRLKKLKAYVAGAGPDPGPEGGKYGTRR